jgi:hypothetical protein
LLVTISYWDCDEVVDWPALVDSVQQLRLLTQAKVCWQQWPAGLREIELNGGHWTALDLPYYDHEHTTE